MCLQKSAGIARGVLGLLLFLMAARVGRAISPTCNLQQPVLRVPRADIFTEQQEQWLGDAQAEMVEPRYILLPEAESAYLTEIGKRLLDQLPPTSVDYTFRVFESPICGLFLWRAGIST